MSPRKELTEDQALVFMGYYTGTPGERARIEAMDHTPGTLDAIADSKRQISRPEMSKEDADDRLHGGKEGGFVLSSVDTHAHKGSSVFSRGQDSVRENLGTAMAAEDQTGDDQTGEESVDQDGQNGAEQEEKKEETMEGNTDETAEDAQSDGGLNHEVHAEEEKQTTEVPDKVRMHR